ncbi:MAG: DsbA family protein [Candidatus Spechtbacteria bacterium SB0662_bin_43]|uniref:DsbA family protein n=1 Tax=Candidatus Spechtbacteria bacterium SB0662_bin_43 TaxID=2604897 RepID=A0A845DBL7_9BACT|nr:DsbA family protein [Candidatus Spechtbacteria bacterium SB0662_bin_43]
MVLYPYKCLFVRFANADVVRGSIHIINLHYFMADDSMKDAIKHEVIEHLEEEAKKYIKKRFPEMYDTPMSTRPKESRLERLALPIAIAFAGLFVGIGLILVAVLGGDGNSSSSGSEGTPTVPVAQAPTDNVPVPSGSADNVPPVTDDDHILGDKDAPVKVVEYSDFACPFCASVHPTLKQIVDEYDGEVAWVYRHFPVLGTNDAAEASECIAELGGNDAFWNFTDYIFDNQATAINAASYEQQAQALGINLSSFQECVSSGRYAQKIQEQMDGGADSGITGTPGNIVIGPDGSAYLVSGAQPISEFKNVIDPLL